MSDPVRDLNNFLQQVQKPTNLVPFLHFNSEQQGPNNQATHTVTYTYKNTIVGVGKGTAITKAKSVAATQALQYFNTYGVPE